MTQSLQKLEILGDDIAYPNPTSCAVGTHDYDDFATNDQVHEIMGNEYSTEAICKVRSLELMFFKATPSNSQDSSKEAIYMGIKRDTPFGRKRITR